MSQNRTFLILFCRSRSRDRNAISWCDFNVGSQCFHLPSPGEVSPFSLPSPVQATNLFPLTSTPNTNTFDTQHTRKHSIRNKKQVARCMACLYGMKCDVMSILPQNCWRELLSFSFGRPLRPTSPQTDNYTSFSSHLPRNHATLSTIIISTVSQKDPLPTFESLPNHPQSNPKQQSPFQPDHGPTATAISTNTSN